ncbi:MAG: sensor histidine kinase, partial [Gammaproteobacteria bacterium]|nr:sensor histidine kinase [Gammaproteobacteria bacterium]
MCSLFLKYLCKSNNYIGFSLLLFFSCTGNISADQLSYNSHNLVNIELPHTELIPSSRIIEDRNKQFTLDNVKGFNSSLSRSSSGNIVSFGFSDAAYWFIVNLYNPSQQSQQRYLFVEPSWIDKIEVNLIYPDAQSVAMQGGDTIVFSQRALALQNSNFKLDLPPGATQLIVRTETRDPYLIKMSLWQEGFFFKNLRHELLYLGFTYGVIVAMLLYNLFLFVSIREKVYASYVFYVFCFLVMHSTYNGYTYAHLWPNSPEWSNWAHSIFIYFFVISGLLFAITFLNLKQAIPQAFRWAKFFLITVIGSFVVLFALGYGWHVLSSILWVVFYAPFVLFLGLIALLDGNRSARFFLTAAIAGFVGSFVTALAVLGLIPFNFYTYHAVDFGMVIDSVLLSLALADRFKIAHIEAEDSKMRLLLASQHYAEQLEQEVAAQTRELRRANATKDRFFSIIAHDLKGPIASLTSLFNEIILDKNDFSDEVLTQVRQTTLTTQHFLEQLLTWSQSQRGQIEFHPESVELKHMLNQATSLLLTQATNKAITLTIEHEKPAWALADEPMLQTILRNLINNAIKFSHTGGKIRILIDEDEKYQLVHILDYGVGISAER